MKDFRYKLDQTSKKYRCPKCGKNTLVRYIDRINLQLLSQEYGRCDRETNCAYHIWPKGKQEDLPFYLKPNTPQMEISTHDWDLVSGSGRGFKNNNFIQFLKSISSGEQVKGAIEKYLIGSSNYWRGSTVFWQIDDSLKVRGGKVLLYDNTRGKRLKNTQGKSYITWVHSLLKIKDFNLSQSLFGLHLINETKSDNLIIGLVESEKTAIIMSIFKPENIWMATGSLHGFKLDMLLPIKPYQILAFPDKGEYSKWNNKAKELNNIGFRIVVSDLLEKQKIKEGSDIADIFIDQSVDEEVRTLKDSDEFDKIEKEQSCKIKNKSGLKYLMETFDCDVSAQRIKTSDLEKIQLPQVYCKKDFK